MLILSRQISECVIIEVPPSTVARRVKVMVTKAALGKVRLGFEMDPEVAVNRLEIQELIDMERAAS